MRKGCTTIVSNNRGHLNPQVRRSPASPWGSFKGTWQTKRKPIQLQTTTKLMVHLSAIDGGRVGSRGSSARSNVSKEGKGGAENEPQSPIGNEGGAPEQPNDESRTVTAEREPAHSPSPSQQGNNPLTPNGSSRPCTACMESIRDSKVQSPDGPRVMSAQLRSRGSSAAGSYHSQTRVQSAGSQVGSPLPSEVPSRPESRMCASGTQSPLGFRPPSLQIHSSSSSRHHTAGSCKAVTTEQRNTSQEHLDNPGPENPAWVLIVYCCKYIIVPAYLCPHRF